MLASLGARCLILSDLPSFNRFSWLELSSKLTKWFNHVDDPTWKCHFRIIEQRKGGYPLPPNWICPWLPFSLLAKHWILKSLRYWELTFGWMQNKRRCSSLKLNILFLIGLVFICWPALLQARAILPLRCCCSRIQTWKIQIFIMIIFLTDLQTSNPVADCDDSDEGQSLTLGCNILVHRKATTKEVKSRTMNILETGLS